MESSMVYCTHVNHMWPPRVYNSLSLYVWLCIIIKYVRIWCLYLYYSLSLYLCLSSKSSNRNIYIYEKHWKKPRRSPQWFATYGSMYIITRQSQGISWGPHGSVKQIRSFDTCKFATWFRKKHFANPSISISIYIYAFLNWPMS